MPKHEHMWPFSGVFLHPTRAYHRPKLMKYFAVTVALLLVAFEVYWLSHCVQLFVYLFHFDSFAELNQVFVAACTKEG